MFKGHPKGLIAAALANMGERFGFYTMMAILVLFLQAKFSLDETNAGIIYSVFYFSIYVLSLVGGIIADRLKNFKGTILVGIITMTLGYLILAYPTKTPVPNQTLFLILSCFALFIIAFGNGLFKGNLQALVGQMYDDPKFDSVRDSGFQIFYMFINVGAVFAPFTAVGIRNWWLQNNGFEYDADLPRLCHSQLEGTLTDKTAAAFQEAANAANMSGPVSNLQEFAANYLNVFTTGFHYAFGIAIGAMLISLVIYIVNKSRFPDVKSKSLGGADGHQEIKMDPKEVKQRLYALFAVFGVVIFFWFSFHQNGLTLTYFAKDYTDLSKININLGGIRLVGAELFQSVNPFFVVFLTPIIVGLFGYLKNRGIEPSTPKKIAIGMFIAAMAYVLMSVGSLNLPLLSEVKAQGGLEDSMKVTPFLLIGTYFILTVAELFISPLGISFVSKVAPPQYQGIMQGLWLGATAVGNQLLFIGAIFYESIPIWITWTIFVVACLISMVTMLVMLRWLERVAK
ncbi:MAG: peptide MFS transporter [Bacteroidales bacterium]|nr:peptide MFS transporter [Bacteroidales bacterium]